MDIYKDTNKGKKKQNRDKITEQTIKPDFYVLTSPHTTP